MKFLIFFALIFQSFQINAQNRYEVSSDEMFQVAHDQAKAGDTIAWTPGIYMDIRQEIDKDGLIVTAQPYGSVLFSGASRAVINADSVTFSGFQYIGGVIGNLDVIRVYGSDILITQVNIQNYTSFKYLRVYEESRRTTISYCNFENRLNLDDQNILSILVDDEPGYHKIQYCSFKNFEGIGNDQGIEPIRIGVSSQGSLDSRTLVEYCYFTKCNGDGEIISHKSRQNVYRYNTFEDNPVAELVLRHGDEGIVYGNFFLNNMGGVRVREGSNHFIYNNYFQGLSRRSIYLQNESSDPLSDIHIYHNTIIDSEEIRLGGNGSHPPSNVFIANNVFTNPKDQLFSEDTGNETWTGNLALGNLGIEAPSTGIINIDPELFENESGFFQPNLNSPVIAAASSEYPTIPLYPGMEYDHKILFDLMKETRSDSLSERSIGASEFSAMVNVRPHANEMNTGPSYLFDNLINYITANASQLYIGSQSESRSIMVSSNTNWTVDSSTDWISFNLLSGIGNTILEIFIDANEVSERRSGIVTIYGGEQMITIDVFQDAGEVVSVLDNIENKVVLYPNPTDGKIKLENIPSGIHRSLIEIHNLDGKNVLSEEYPILDGELFIEMDSLVPGIYMLNIRFMGQYKGAYKDVKRRIVRL